MQKDKIHKTNKLSLSIALDSISVRLCTEYGEVQDEKDEEKERQREKERKGKTEGKILDYCDAITKLLIQLNRLLPSLFPPSLSSSLYCRKHHSYIDPMGTSMLNITALIGVVVVAGAFGKTGGEAVQGEDWHRPLYAADRGARRV